MDHNLALALALLVAASGRMHGIGACDVRPNATAFERWFAKAMNFLAPGKRLASTIILALGMAVGAYHLIGWLTVPLAAVTVLGFSTGHGRFFAMQGANTNDPNPEWIEKHIVLPLYHGDIMKPLYSWVCMAVKGALIGLPIFPYTLFTAAAWPLGYAIGMKYFKSTAFGEWFSTIAAALTLLLIL